MDNNNHNHAHDGSNTDDILDIINNHHRETQNRIPEPAPDPTTEVSRMPKATPHHNAQAHPSQNSSGINTPQPTGNISLDDFTDPVHTERVPKKKRERKEHFYLSGIAKVVVYLVAVFGISVFISINAIKIGNDVFAFVKENVDVTVVVPEGATTSDVAKILEKNGVIKYPFIYKLYTNFRIDRRSYLTGEYKVGEVVVNKSQNYDQLLASLSLIKNSKEVVRITIPEGFTVDEILALFESKGMKNASEFTQALQEYEYEYRFMDNLNENPISDYRYDVNYGYRLEGYLFPDTYDFYVDENPISAISKLLDNFNLKFDASFYDRCNELGYTVDEIITLASIIEAEGDKVEDYSKISSVFHNRLNNSSTYPYLESDATVQYALGAHKNKLDSKDTEIDSPYNTYKYKGLPPGPICNPGYESIYAALYPEDTNYYYFLSRNDGVTVYSKTYDGHLNAIAESNRIDAELANNQ